MSNIIADNIRHYESKGFVIPKIGDYVSLGRMGVPLARVVNYFFLPYKNKADHKHYSQFLIGVVINKKFKQSISRSGLFSGRYCRRGTGQGARDRIKKYEEGGDKYFFGVSPLISLTVINNLTALTRMIDRGELV